VYIAMNIKGKEIPHRFISLLKRPEAAGR
jgi:hypothetical protein